MAREKQDDPAIKVRKEAPYRACHNFRAPKSTDRGILYNAERSIDVIQGLQTVICPVGKIGNKEEK